MLFFAKYGKTLTSFYSIWLYLKKKVHWTHFVTDRKILQAIDFTTYKVISNNVTLTFCMLLDLLYLLLLNFSHLFSKLQINHFSGSLKEKFVSIRSKTSGSSKIQSYVCLASCPGRVFLTPSGGDLITIVALLDWHLILPNLYIVMNWTLCFCLISLQHYTISFQHSSFLFLEWQLIVRVTRQKKYQLAFILSFN